MCRFSAFGECADVGISSMTGHRDFLAKLVFLIVVSVLTASVNPAEINHMKFQKKEGTDRSHVKVWMASGKSFLFYILVCAP